MRIKIRLLRQAGVLCDPAATELWHEGLLETESHSRGRGTTRRLVLRSFGATPDMGVIAALYQPMVVAVDHTGMRLRGIEEVDVGGGHTAAMVQEWIVEPNPATVPWSVPPR